MSDVASPETHAKQMESQPSCWFCHGWGLVERVTHEKTAWSDATGGADGQRFPIYHLMPAFGTTEHGGELLECPVCGGSGFRK